MSEITDTQNTAAGPTRELRTELPAELMDRLDEFTGEDEATTSKVVAEAIDLHLYLNQESAPAETEDGSANES